MASDASLVGGGAVHGKEYVHFRFPQYMMQEMQHIAQRELLTIMVALKIWHEELQGKVLRFSTDNQWAMHAINSGSTRGEYMLNCIREVAWICAKNHILLRAVYIESKSNHIPDILSRWYIPCSNARRKFKCATDKTWIRRSCSTKLFRFDSPWYCRFNST